ncbi:MAG: endonuclease III, partial [Thermoplasmata archaeon]
ELTLDPLKEWDHGEVFRFLTEIPGGGTKTAAVVMIISLGTHFFPVDTHIRRVAERLGWVGEGTPRERTQEILDALIPDEDKFEGHLLLIEHGRRYCRARRPLCNECPVVDLCPFPKKRRRGPT